MDISQHTNLWKRHITTTIIRRENILNRTLSISIFKGYLYISYGINGVSSGSDTYKLAEIYQIKEYFKKFIKKFSVKKEKRK